MLLKYGTQQMYQLNVSYFESEDHCLQSMIKLANAFQSADLSKQELYEMRDKMFPFAVRKSQDKPDPQVEEPKQPTDKPAEGGKPPEQMVDQPEPREPMPEQKEAPKTLPKKQNTSQQVSSLPPPAFSFGAMLHDHF